MQRPFGVRAQPIQRCLNTKPDQVINGLPEASQAFFSSRLRQAWQLLDATRAESALLEIHADLLWPAFGLHSISTIIKRNSRASSCWLPAPVLPRGRIESAQNHFRAILFCMVFP